MTEEKKPGDEVIEDMSLEDTAEEKEEKQKDAEKVAADMSLDESAKPGPEGFKARIDKLFPAGFPAGDYTYVGNAPLVKLPNGGYSLKGIALADLSADDLKELDEYLKSREG